jgi:branched-chain amino acid transport system ATP-binding protein
MNDGTLLQLEDVHAYYGLSHVLQGVSLRVPVGTVVSLMGRNGVGKTTTLKSVLGLVSVRRGRICFAGANLAGLGPYQIARLGIALVPEDRRIFSNLTVAENIRLAAGGRKGAVREVLAWFPNLQASLDRPGDQLSGGEQQMLAIARALVAHPRLILIDEPLEGLAPVIAECIEAVLESLRGRTTVLLVDQNLKWVMQVAQHHYLMDHGRIVHDGDSSWLRAHPELVERYLGVGT